MSLDNPLGGRVYSILLRLPHQVLVELKATAAGDLSHREYLLGFFHDYPQIGRESNNPQLSGGSSTFPGGNLSVRRKNRVNASTLQAAHHFIEPPLLVFGKRAVLLVNPLMKCNAVGHGGAGRRRREKARVHFKYTF
jgi:hypothetical protein